MSITISRKTIEQAYSYEQYWQLIRDLIAKNQTTGSNHSESYLHYTNLNIQRMERQDDKISLDDDTVKAFQMFEEKMIWLVLAEWWCGDVAQNLPAIHKMAGISANVEMKILLRDENLEIMDQFLTNGGRSIPKLLVINPVTMEVVDHWGPRTAEAQQILIDFKANPNGRTQEDFHQELHLWYAQNKNKSIQTEFLAKLPLWSKAVAV